MRAPTRPAETALRARARTSLAGVAALGFAGSIAVAAAAWGAGALPEQRSPGGWLEDVPLVGALPVVDHPAAYVLWALGLAGLSAAWVLLRRRTVVAGHGVSVPTIVGLAALWMAPLLLAPPMTSRDVYSYVAHGELASRGIDPGVEPPLRLGLTSPVLRAVDPVWRNVVSAYGPANTGLSEVAVDVTGHDVEAAVLVWRLLAVVGVALMGLGVAVLARAHERDPVDALAWAIAGPLTVVQLVGGPHNEALMVGLMAAGLAVATRPGRRAWVAGVALCALGAAVKAPAVLGAVYLGWAGGRPHERATPPVALARRVGRTVVAGLISLGVLEITSLVAGVGWGWLGGLSAGSNVTSLLSVSTTIGLVVAFLVGQPVHLGPAVTAVRDGFLAVALMVAGVLLWRTPKLGLAGLAAALLVLAVLGPAVHPWYVTWCLPPAAVVLAGRRATAAMVVAIAVAASSRPMGQGVVRNLGNFPLPTLVAMAVVALVLWRWWGRRRLTAQPATRSA
jgi:hypothetical protein